MRIPEASRAQLSGYVQGDGACLPWSWVEERMNAARTYWISARSDGFPCSRPVWGLWWPPEPVFSTGGALATHMRRDDRVQVSVEAGDDVVIVEGRVRTLADADAARWAREYSDKYNWEMPETSKDVYVVRPKRIQAWRCDNSGRDGGAAFHASATAWKFDTPG
jgi:hypothetical protein